MYSTSPIRRGRLDAPFPEHLVGTDLHWAYREALYRFRHRPEVTGISLGAKIENHQCLETVSVRVHVREKYPKSVLSKREILPTEIVGVPLDVLQRVYLAEACSVAEGQLVGGRADPVQPGFGIGRVGPEVGTFGMVVFEASQGRPALLSAAHVLAIPDGQNNDPIVQPYWGSEADDTIARLTGPWVFDERGDAAYALLTGERRINPAVHGASPVLVRGVRMPNQKEVLWKSGYRTCRTRGMVESCCGDIQVEYKFLKRTLTMQGFEIRPLQEDEPNNERLSDTGDSGAIWMDENGFAVGLHIAGQQVPDSTAERALACFLPTILKDLGLIVHPPEGIPLPDFFTDAEPQPLVL